MNWTIPEIEGNLAEQIEDAGNCILGEASNCKKLRILNLSFNSLTGPLPDGLRGLESLIQ